MPSKAIISGLLHKKKKKIKKEVKTLLALIKETLNLLIYCKVWQVHQKHFWVIDFKFSCFNIKI